MTQGGAGSLLPLLPGLAADLGLTILPIEPNMRVVMEVSGRRAVLSA